MLLLYILCIKTKMWKKSKDIELYMITISCESHYAKCFLLPFILLFSPPSLLGLRGAIPYALSLHLGLEPIEKRQLIGTTTIIIVLFTILFLGGGTMPLIRIMDIEDSQSRRKNKKDVNLSKTQKMVMIEAPRVLAHGGHTESLLSVLVLAAPSSHLPSGSFCALQREKTSKG